MQRQISFIFPFCRQAPSSKQMMVRAWAGVCGMFIRCGAERAERWLIMWFLSLRGVPALRERMGGPVWRVALSARAPQPRAMLPWNPCTQQLMMLGRSHGGCRPVELSMSKIAQGFWPPGIHALPPWNRLVCATSGIFEEGWHDFQASIMMRWQTCSFLGCLLWGTAAAMLWGHSNSPLAPRPHGEKQASCHKPAPSSLLVWLVHLGRKDLGLSQAFRGWSSNWHLACSSCWLEVCSEIAPKCLAHRNWDNEWMFIVF